MIIDWYYAIKRMQSGCNRSRQLIHFIFAFDFAYANFCFLALVSSRWCKWFATNWKFAKCYAKWCPCHELFNRCKIHHSNKHGGSHISFRTIVEVVAFDRNRKWLLSLSHQKSINACVARTPVTELGQNSFTTFTDLAKKKMDNEGNNNAPEKRWRRKKQMKEKDPKDRRENYWFRLDVIGCVVVNGKCRC